MIEALADQPARFLMTTGADDIGPVPPNVSVLPWMPQDAVLEGADAVVSHGGYGTVLGALAHGLPGAVEHVLLRGRYARVAGELAADIAALPPVADAVSSLHPEVPA